MKNCWSILILAALLQSFAIVVLGGGNHHGHGSSLAHILAAGLIVQLLGSRQHHQSHHHHQGRHSGADIHSEHSPYGQGREAWGVEHNPMTPEATYSSSTWAQRAPMDIAYSHAQYKEPTMESYNVPYFYRPPGIWGK